MIFDLSLPDGQFKKTADNSKLISLIGNFEFTKINQGINKTIEWFVENYNLARK
jgi:GDP-L-fucose synthase